ncbi:hypothetical protein ABZ917_34375 [Nonomuraea wenchangensis]
MGRTDAGAPATVVPASRHVMPGGLCSDHVETELPCRARRLTVAADAGLEVEVVCPFDWAACWRASRSVAWDVVMMVYVVGVACHAPRILKRWPLITSCDPIQLCDGCRDERRRVVHKADKWKVRGCSARC